MADLEGKLTVKEGLSISAGAVVFSAALVALGFLKDLPFLVGVAGGGALAYSLNSAMHYYRLWRAEVQRLY